MLGDWEQTHDRIWVRGARGWAQVPVPPAPSPPGPEQGHPMQIQTKKCPRGGMEYAFRERWRRIEEEVWDKRMNPVTMSRSSIDAPFFIGMSLSLSLSDFLIF